MKISLHAFVLCSVVLFAACSRKFSIAGKWQVLKPSPGSMEIVVKSQEEGYADRVRGTWIVDPRASAATTAQSHGRLWGDFDRDDRTLWLHFSDSTPGKGTLDGTPSGAACGEAKGVISDNGDCIVASVPHGSGYSAAAAATWTKLFGTNMNPYFPEDSQFIAQRVGASTACKP